MAKIPSVFPHELLLTKYKLVADDLSAEAKNSIKTFDAALDAAEKMDADKFTDTELANLNKLSGVAVADINDFIEEQQKASDAAEQAQKEAEQAAAAAKAAEEAAIQAQKEAEAAALAAKQEEEAAAKAKAQKEAEEAAAAAKAAEEAAVKAAAEKAAAEARQLEAEKPLVGIWALL